MNFRRLLWPALICAIISLAALWAPALILVGVGNDPVHDGQWPAGSLALANLKTRVGWWEGPPFGGGRPNFLYRGDTAAFQQSLDAFAKINWPRLDLFIHDGGPATSPFLKDTKNPKSNDRYDWSFTVWNPRSWNHLYNSPGSYFSAGDPSGAFGQEVAAPRIDVFPAKGGIDLSHVAIPARVHVTDERADVNGFADGSALVADAYDLTTSKPIENATVTLEDPAAKDHRAVVSGKTDANGHLVLRTVPPGSYQVGVSAAGYAPRSLGYAEFHANTFRRFQLRLAPIAHVRGTVLDNAGKPIPHATVRADSVMGPDGRGYPAPADVQAESDQNGNFELKGLPLGHALFFASAPAYAMLDVLKLQSLPDEKLILRMTSTGTIKVRVLMHDGKPAAHGNVSVDAPGRPLGSWGGSADTKPDGTFTFEGVPPGTYVISAMATNPGPAPSPTDQKKTIQMTAGQTIDVEITGR